MGKKGDPKGIPNFPGWVNTLAPHKPGTQLGGTGPSADQVGTQPGGPG